MNARLGRATVNKSGIFIFLRDMAHPEMKKAWLRNVFANIWHFIQGKKKKSRPLSFQKFLFLCLFPPNII